MKISPRIPWVSAFVVITLAAVVLAACGGGSSVTGPSSSSGGATGGGTASLQGQVVNSQGASTGRSGVVVALRTALSPALAEAVTGTPVAGATVKLLQGATLVATTTTDANGQFVFHNVDPGSYTIQVLVGGVVVATTSVIVVGADDQAIVGIATSGGSTVTVTATSTDVFDNDAQLGHAINIADAAGSKCDLVKVTQLRQSGLGWGVIAQQCGVSPGVIGLGRSNLSDDDLDNAREEHGHARLHGPSHGNAGNGGNGKGKGKS